MGESSTPSTLHFTLQLAIGIAISLCAAGIVTTAALLNVEIVTAMWVAFFVIVWITTFIALRRHWYAVVAGIVIGTSASYMAAKILFRF